MKRRDAIIDDLHKVRQAIGRTHDFDVHRIAATIRQHEDKSRLHVIRELPWKGKLHQCQSFRGCSAS